MQEKFKLLDEIRVVHRNKDGKILSDRTINNGFWNRLLCKLGIKHNCITSGGMAVVAGLLLLDVGGTAFDFIAIGTGTTAAAVGDDATYNHSCQNEQSRLAAVGTRIQTTYANDTAQLVITFSQAADAGLTGIDAITEVIMVNNVTPGSGVMLLRQVYTPADNCNWDAGDTLQVTVKVQVKQGS
jgi:hypothetical protein